MSRRIGLDMQNAKKCRRVIRVASVFGITFGVISILAGCVVIPKEYINIPNRMRLSTTSLSFPEGTNVLRFATEKGAWQSRIRLRNVAVRRGTLTFYGKDGTVSFTTNNTLTVNMKMLDEVVFPMREQQICFYLDEQSMHIDGGIDPKAKWKWIEQNGATDLRDLSPSLIFHFTNGYWLVDIPFDKSEDFDGNIGEMSIIPNWYDGKR